MGIPDGHLGAQFAIPDPDQLADSSLVGIVIDRGNELPADKFVGLTAKHGFHGVVHS